MNIINETGICVLAEHKNGKLLDVSLELISQGKKIAKKLNVKLTVLLLGHNIEYLIESLIKFGATNIVFVDNPLLDCYNLDVYTKVISDLIIKRNLGLLFIGATSRGNKLASNISSALGLELTTDCVSLDINSITNYMLITRKTLSKTICKCVKYEKNAAKVITVKPGVFKKQSRDIYAGNVERILLTI